MYRSALSPTKLFCQSDARIVVASAGLSGAESICTDASRDTSIVTPPSSANRIASGAAMITWFAAVSDVYTGNPSAVPPITPNPGKSDCPSGFSEAPSASAFVSDMINAHRDGAMLAATIAAASARMSVRALLGDVPADVIGVIPFVIEPGDTFATGATVGSVNC